MQICDGVRVLGLEDVLLDPQSPPKKRLCTMLGLIQTYGEPIIDEAGLVKLAAVARDSTVAADFLAEAIVSALDLSEVHGPPEPTPDAVLRWYLAWRGIELPAQPVVPLWVGVSARQHANLVKVAARRDLTVDQVIQQAIARYIADDDVLWDAGID